MESVREPFQCAAAGQCAGREAALQQVATGRRFPVEHLAGDEHAGTAPQHQVFVDGFPANAAGGRDRGLDRRRSGEAHRNSFRECGQCHRVQLGELRMRSLVQQSDLDGREACRLAQERRQRLLATRLGKARRKVGEGHVRAQVDVQQRGGSRRDGIAQGCGKCIDRTALDACSGDQGFATHGRFAERQRDALHGLALEAAAERFRPIDAEAAIGRRQRGNGDATLGEQRSPIAGRAEPRPACPAERQHGGVGGDGLLLVGRGEQQPPAIVPAEPAPASAELDPATRELGKPGAQQRRRLHGDGKHPAAGADEGRLAERFAPGAYGVRWHGFDGGPKVSPAQGRSERESARYPRYG